MSDLTWCEPPPRPEFVARVRAALGELGASLRILAQDVLGADARIDLVAADPDGRLTLVLWTTGGEELALIALGLAQRAWVEARLPDWIQLGPQLGLRPEARVRLLLLAPEFSPTAVAAVRAADPEEIDLVRFRCFQGNGSDVQVLLEPLRFAGATRPAAAPRRPGSAPPAVRFRSGLSDADLDLTPDERRGLD